MRNDTIIDALETCKAILVQELKKELLNKPDHEAEVDVKIVGWVDDYEGNWGHELETITKVWYSDEKDMIFVIYDGYDHQYEDEIDLFNIGEIASIIDDM